MSDKLQVGSYDLLPNLAGLRLARMKDVRETGGRAQVGREVKKRLKSITGCFGSNEVHNQWEVGRPLLDRR